MSWTDGDITQLKSLWQQGFSASQIAARLGRVTRNSVIGKVHRLGLTNNNSRGTQHRRYPRQNGWKSEELALLKSGKSARELASEIGRTIAAVRQQRQLQGITPSQRQRPHNPYGRKGKTRSVTSYGAVTNAEIRSMAPIEPPPEPRGDKPTLMQLRAGECKWPFGDPRHPEFHFCGQDTGDIERPYCPGHASMAYRAL